MLGKLNARGSISLEAYTNLFGRVDADTAPYGTQVWKGMKTYLLDHYRRSGSKSADQVLKEFFTARNTQKIHQQLRLGWFCCPSPFSRMDAMRSRDLDDAQTVMYPAFFLLVQTAEHGVTTVRVRMLCLALMLRNSHAWDVNLDRVFCLQDASYTADLQETWDSHPGWRF